MKYDCIECGKPLPDDGRQFPDTQTAEAQTLPQKPQLFGSWLMSVQPSAQHQLKVDGPTKQLLPRGRPAHSRAAQNGPGGSA